MAEVKKPLPIAHAIRALIKKEKKMEKVHLASPMAPSILACSSKTCCTARANTLGMMVRVT